MTSVKNYSDTVENETKFKYTLPNFFLDLVFLGTKYFSET